MARAVAQGPTCNGTDVLFELIDGAARLGPVAGIVHPRRDFIDYEPDWRDEQFNPHGADVIQRIQYISGQQHGVCPLRVGEFGGNGCGVQDPVAMHVFTWVKARD